MNRWKALTAVALAGGLAVFVVATASGDSEPMTTDTPPPSSKAATPNSAVQSSETPRPRPAEPVTTLTTDSVAPFVEPTVMSAFDEAVRPATQSAPDVTDATSDSAEYSPDVTIAERDRTAAEEAANKLLAEFLSVVTDVDADEPADVVAQFSSIASQAILSEVEAERLEFESLGWSREGEYVVDGVEVLSYAEVGTSATATVRVCLDSSDIIVRQTDGSAVDPGAGSRRAWNIYVLERDAGTWRLVGRTFPDDPAC